MVRLMVGSVQRSAAAKKRSRPLFTQPCGSTYAGSSSACASRVISAGAVSALLGSAIWKGSQKRRKPGSSLRTSCSTRASSIKETSAICTGLRLPSGNRPGVNWKCAKTCASEARNSSLPPRPLKPRNDCGTRIMPLPKLVRCGVSKPAGGNTRIGGEVCHSAAMKALSSRSTLVNTTPSAPCSSACSVRVSNNAKNFSRFSGSFSAERIPPSAQLS